MSKDQNLLGTLIDERLRSQGLKASKVAESAEINETTFSAVRRGRRTPSRDVVIKLAVALSTNSDDQEEDINEFLLAAGYAPSQMPKKRSVVIQLLSVEALLQIESSMEQGQQVWVFSKGLIETLNDNFYRVVCKNLKKGVSYTYFFHHSNAVDWVKLIERLGSQLSNFESLKGFVFPDECFPSTDINLFECVYDAQNAESFRVFRTSREVEEDYLYREVNNRDAADVKLYLQGLLAQATAGQRQRPPCPIVVFLKEKYGLDLTKLPRNTRASGSK